MSSETSSAAQSSGGAATIVPPGLKAPPALDGSGGLIAAILGLSACLAVFVGGGLAYRTGHLRLPPRA